MIFVFMLFNFLSSSFSKICRPKLEKIAKIFGNDHGLPAYARGYGAAGSGFETCSLPCSLAATRRGFSFYVAVPTSSIRG
jgi:hypothetical protein